MNEPRSENYADSRNAEDGTAWNDSYKEIANGKWNKADKRIHGRIHNELAKKMEEKNGYFSLKIL